MGHDAKPKTFGIAAGASLLLGIANVMSLVIIYLRLKYPPPGRNYGGMEVIGQLQLSALVFLAAILLAFFARRYCLLCVAVSAVFPIGFFMLESANAQPSQIVELGPQATDADVIKLVNDREVPTHLEAHGQGITDKSLASLGRSEGYFHPLTLDFGYTSVTDAGLKHLNKEPFRSVMELELNRTKISDKGLVHLKSLDDLQKLSLDGTAVDGSGLKHLVELPKLRSLYLRQTNVSDEAITDLKKMKKLWRLDLRETKISDEGLKELVEALPDTAITPQP